MVINGLPLPQELVDLVEAGRWECPSDGSGLAQLIRGSCEFCFYTFEQMERETRMFRAVPSMFKNPPPISYWFGVADPADPPGDFDPHRAVLIGDLGWGSDAPIALDYRLSMERPRVIYLGGTRPEPPVPWEEIELWRKKKRRYDAEMTARIRRWEDCLEQRSFYRWREIAPDFNTFAVKAGFSSGPRCQRSASRFPHVRRSFLALCRFVRPFFRLVSHRARFKAQ